MHEHEKMHQITDMYTVSHLVSQSDRHGVGQVNIFIPKRNERDQSCNRKREERGEIDRGLVGKRVEGQERRYDHCS